MTPQAQKVFAIGAVFTYPFKEKYLLEIVKKNEDINSISKELNSLMKVSLIEKNKEFYSYHPLLRDYALKKLYSFPFSEAIFEAYKEHLAYLQKKKIYLLSMMSYFLFWKMIIKKGILIDFLKLLKI